MNALLPVRKAFGVVATFFLAAGALLSAPADAALKCQELTAYRSCSDSAPKAYTIAAGQSVMVPAPIMSGFDTACWSWNRQFQCVETEPILSCDSGANFNTVKNTCNLTAASVNASVTINSLTYITDATYTYRCAFGDWTSTETLPTNRECVALDTTTAVTGTASAAPTGATPSSASLTTTINTQETRTSSYACYSPPQTVCTNKCYEQVVDSRTGTIDQREVACTSPVTNCVTANEQCNPNGSTGLTLGPDGRCVSSTQSQMCQNGPVPRCLDESSCTLDSTAPASVQDNGFAMAQEQTYICSNSTTACAEYTTLSNCTRPNAWGWDKFSFNGKVGEGLGDFNRAMSQVEGIEKGLQEEDPYIFSGENLRCHYAIGNFLNTAIMVVVVVATLVITGGASAGLLSTALQSQAIMGTAAMTATTANAVSAAVSIGGAALADAPNSRALGADCCKDYVIEGSDAWYKLGSCNADEVKLAVARQKGLYHYLGEYCSKKSGFPVRQCVEKTKSYCTFDDMLALVVNEQGRRQLDELAAADATTTKSTAEQGFSLFNTYQPSSTYKGVLNNGRWVQLNTLHNSQVWAWQYPGYCKSSSTQAAAYTAWEAEINRITNTQGTQPGDMTVQQAAQVFKDAVALVPFQECSETPGMLSMLTCSRLDDACSTSMLPDGPTDLEVDLTGAGAEISSDPNWRIQQIPSFRQPGEYGVTAVMSTNSSFAAVTESISEFATSVGSCHADGACLYRFAITDKNATGGLGARKRAKDYVNFPLYTVVPNSAWPAVTYVSQNGALNTAAWQADPNRGLGTPLAVGTQRFIFRPNYLTGPLSGNIHSHVLLEWATKKVSTSTPEADFVPLMVPTSLPPATTNWYPHRSPTAVTTTTNSKGVTTTTVNPHEQFYLTGSCDPGSRWCSYEVGIDLDIKRHPWGSAKAPRCWGFSVEQMAALDFDRMDLSKWINSLDLDALGGGMSQEAATAMADQVTASAQSFYGAFSDGTAVNNPNPGTVSLVTNTDILPKLTNDKFRAYTLEAAVPANWPAWYDTQANNNPVTNVRVDWGDGSPVQSMTLASTGRGYYAEHDYGDKPVGTYKIQVTLNTAANGQQTLSTHVTISPDKGQAPDKTTELDFNNPGTSGQLQGEYVPAMMPNGSLQSPDALETLAPGMGELYDQQGSTVTK